MSIVPRLLPAKVCVCFPGEALAPPDGPGVPPGSRLSGRESAARAACVQCRGAVPGCSAGVPAAARPVTLSPSPQVPEIISSIRQAGKIARQEELHCPSEFDDTFAKKFEVLFCGRVTVAHKKAPPALIDECIEKFNHVSCSRKAEFALVAQNPEAPPEAPPGPAGGRSLAAKVRGVLQPVGNGEQARRPMRKSFSQPGLRSLAFKKELHDGSLRSSSFFSSFEESDIENHLVGGHNIVQPTDIEDNRTMLFTVKYPQAPGSPPG